MVAVFFTPRQKEFLCDLLKSDNTMDFIDEVTEHGFDTRYSIRKVQNEVNSIKKRLRCGK